MADSITLLQVVLHPKVQRLEAVVRDTAASKARKIVVRWDTKDPAALPDYWWRDIVDEVRFQQGEEDRGMPSLPSIFRVLKPED